MKVLVDTSIWSLALRRLRSGLNRDELRLVEEWDQLVLDGRAQMIGPIRQEVLSGIRDRAKFEALNRVLSPFENEVIRDRDYIDAAQVTNQCRSHGVAVSAIDALICAVAIRLQSPIFSSDKDFSRIGRFVAVPLHTPQRPVKRV